MLRSPERRLIHGKRVERWRPARKCQPSRNSFASTAPPAVYGLLHVGVAVTLFLLSRRQANGDLAAYSLRLAFGSYAVMHPV
jgi:hypothetical protein